MNATSFLLKGNSLIILCLIIIFSVGCVQSSQGATNTATAGTTWAGATWSLGHVPLSTEDVVINSNLTMTVGTAAVCNSLTIGSATVKATTVTIGTGGSLSVVGNVNLNPQSVNAAMTLAVAAYTLTVGGTVQVGSVSTQTISVTTGTINFTNSTGFQWSYGTLKMTGAGTITFAGNLNQSGGTISNATAAGTINFNGGFLFNGGTFTTLASETINFGSDLNAQSTLTFVAGSKVVFNANSPNINSGGTLTLGDVQINSGVTVNANNDILVAGATWVNNGGTFNPGGNNVFFTGIANQSIGGTATSQTFNNIVLQMTAGKVLSTTGSTTTLNVSNFTETTGNFTSPATLNISGNLTLSAGTFTAGSLININGNWVNDGATFTPGSNTVDFLTSGSSQNISGSTSTSFYKLYIDNNQGGVSLSQPVTIKTLTIGYTNSNSAFYDSGYAITTATTLNLTNGTYYCGGATFPWGTSNITAGQTVAYIGTSAQTIKGGVSYSILSIDNTVGATLGANTTMSSLNIGDLVNNSIFNDAAYTISTATSVNMISGTYNCTATTFPWVTLNASPGTSVNFSKAGAQTVANQAYWNLTLSGSGTKTVQSMTVSGIMNISTGVVASLVNGTDDPVNLLQLNGSYQPAGTTGNIVSGALNINNTYFASKTGYLTVLGVPSLPTDYYRSATNGNWSNYFTWQSSPDNVNWINASLSPTSAAAYITIAGPYQTVADVSGLTASNIEVAGWFVINNSNVFYVSGNWIFDGGCSFSQNTGTVVFNGASNAIISGGTSQEVFNNIIVAMSAGKALTVSNMPLNLIGSMTLTSGTFIPGNEINIGGNWIDNGGTFMPGIDTITFNGINYYGTPVTDTIEGSSSTNFATLIVNSGASVQLGNTTGITTLDISSGGIFYDGGYTVTSADTINMSNGNPEYVCSATGATAFPWANTNIPAGTVDYNGASAQTIRPFTYSTLKINNAAGAILGGTNTVGTLIIGDETANSIFNDGGFAIGTATMLTLSSGTYYCNTSTLPWATANIGSSTTVNYSLTGAQTVKAFTYSNLVLSGSGAKTCTAASVTGNLTIAGAAAMTNTAALTVAGNVTMSGTSVLTTGNSLSIRDNLTVGDGSTFNAGAFALTVIGNTMVGAGTSGSLTISSTTGTKAFDGKVTIASGANWNNTGNSPITIGGDMAVNTATGSFVAGTGLYTFTGTGDSISGTANPIAIPSVSFTGTYTNIATLTTATAFTATNAFINSGTITAATALTITGANFTNNGSVTASTALSGTGAFTQGANAMLNIGGTAGIATLDAGATGNTVNYTGASQAINGGNYYNLNLTGSGVPVMNAGTGSVGGNLTTGGTLTGITAAASVVIGGNFTIIAGCTFNPAAYTYSVGGNMINNGTVTSATTGEIMLTNGSAAHTISGTGTYNNLELNDATYGAAISGNVNIPFTGTFKLTNGALNTGAYTLTLTLNTAGGSVTSSGGTIGSSSNNGTLVVTGNTTLSSILNLTSSAQTLNAFTLNLTGTGTPSLTIGGNLTLANAGTCFTMTQGNLTMNGTLTMSSSSAAFVLTSGIVSMGNNQVIYKGAAAGGMTSTGLLTSYFSFYGANSGFQWNMSGIAAGTYRWPIGIGGSGAAITGFRPVTITTAGNVTSNVNIGFINASDGSANYSASNIPASGNIMAKYIANLTTSASIGTPNITMEYLSAANDFSGTPTLASVAIWYYSMSGSGLKWTTTGTQTSNGTDGGTQITITKNSALALTSAGTYPLNLAQTNADPGITAAYTWLWTGASSSAWATLGNWTVNGATATAVPGATSTVLITNAAVTQPIISATTAISVNNMTIGNGCTLKVTGNNTTTIKGAFTNNGTFTATNGTVTYGGTAPQVIAPGNYFKLTNSSTTTAILSPSGTIGIASTFTPGTATYTSTGSTINFNGTAAQTIPAFTYYNNIIASNSVSTTLGGAITIIAGGNLTITTPVFDDGTYKITPTATAGTFTLSGTSTYNVNYAVASPVPSFTTYIISPISTFNYSAISTANQAILVSSALAYGNVSINNQGSSFTKTLATGFICYGNLTIGNSAVAVLANGGIFTVYGNINITATLTSGTTSNLYCGGNWTNNGTFNVSTGTVIFNGSGTHTLNGSDASFNNLTLNSASLNLDGTPVTQPLNVLGVFTLVAGTFSDTGTITLNTVVLNGGTFNAAQSAVQVSGNWTNNGAIYTPAITGNGSVTFTQNANQSIGGAVPTTFGDVIINAPGNGFAATLTGNESCATLTIAGGNGTLNVGSYALTSNGEITIIGVLNVTTGTVNVNNSSFYIYNGAVTTGAANINLYNSDFNNNGGSFTSTGTVTYTGTGTHYVLGSDPLFYNLIINSSGLTVDATGTNPTSVTNNFTINNGTFLGPEPFNVNNLILNSGGAFTSQDIVASGVWTNNGGTFIQNGTTYFGANTSIGGTTTTTFGNVYVAGGTTTLNIATICQQMNVGNGTTTGTLAVGGQTLYCYDNNLYINTGCALSITTGTLHVSNGTLYNMGTLALATDNFTGTIDLDSSDWNNTGTWNYYQSTIAFNGSDGYTHYVDNDNQTFYNLTINNLIDAVTYPVSLTVTNDLTINSGNFSPPTILNAKYLTVNNGYINGNDTINMAAGGIWTNNAAAVSLSYWIGYNPSAPMNQIVNFTAGGNINGSATNFQGLQLVSGTLTIGANTTLIVDGQLTLTGGAFQSSNSVTLEGQIVQTAGSFTNSGTVYYQASDFITQNIATGSYNNLTFDFLNKILPPANINIAGVFTPTLSGYSIATGNTTTNNTITFTGGPTQVIPAFNWDGTNGTGYNNVTYTTTKVLGGNALVSNVLNFSTNGAVLTLDSFNLTIGAAGSITATPGTQQMILENGTGQLIRQFTAGSNQTFLYPIGTTGAYSPVALNFHTVSTGGPVGASVYSTYDPNAVGPPNPSTNWLTRYWTLSNVASTFAFDNYSATCAYTPSTDIPAGPAFTYLTMDAETWNGSSWQTPTISSRNASGTETISNITSLGDITFAGCNGGPQYTSLNGTNPTGCESINGSITLSGLTAGTTYLLDYMKANVSQPEDTLTANSTGTILLINLGAGMYTNFALSLNGCTSNPTGSITLVDTTTITSPSPASICNGNNATFSVTTAGSVTGYQWYENGISLGANNGIYSGTQTTTLTLNAPSLNLSGRTYYCVVTSPCNTAQSGAATLTITGTSVTPVTATVCNGGAGITLTASGGTSYSWSPSTGLNATTGSNVTANPTATTSYTVTGTSGSCNTSATAMVTVNNCSPTNVTWTGTTSTNWFDPTNWNPESVPNLCATNITVPATSRQPVISSGSVSIGNVSIASGATITLQGQNLNICGNWTGGTGTNAAVVGSGTVYMNSGTGAQIISGNTQFTVLQVNNTSGVTLASGATVAIATGLQLQVGNLNISAGSLHLLSTAGNNNSYIDDFTGSGTLTGSTVKADRYVQVAGYNQHYISSPVSIPSFSQLNASGTDGSYVIPFTGCDEYQSAYNSPYGSVFQYNDGHAASGACMLGNWEIRSQGNLVNGLGYSTYLTGNSTLSLTGYANTGNINAGNLNNSGYPTVYTLQDQPIESGWNLVGNPYPSAIALTASRVAQGFQNQVQIWITDGPFSGSWQYAVIDSSPSSVLTIAPFQAFMVRIIPGSTGMHSYPFYQSERTRTTNVSFYRTEGDNTLELNLAYNGMSDVATVSFKPNATNGFDDAYDANKPDGGQGRPTLYTTMNDNHWYGLNCVPPLTQVTTIPVGLHPEATGTMTIAPVGIESFDPTTYIYLEDKQAGTIQDMRSGAYTFNTNINDAQDRFVLHFTPPAEIMTSDAACSSPGIISITQPGTASWTYTVTDNNNALISSGTLNETNPVTVNANAGIYTLTLTDNNGYTVVKNIQVGGSQPMIAAFTTSTTTAQTSQNISFASSTGNGAAYSWNFGDGTTATGQTAIHQYTEPGAYTAGLIVTNNSGCTSTTTRVMTINAGASTGITNLNGGETINIWSNGNIVYVDFSKQTSVNADVEIYNVLGQILSSEKFGKSDLYTKEIDNLEAAYLIIRVTNEVEVTTKKVFIANANK